jgi:hypothetical protein
MILNIQERLTLVNVIPERANFETMKMIEALKELLYPSEEETIKFDIKQLEKTISWNKEGSVGIEIKLTKGMKDLLIKQLQSFSEKEQLDYSQYLMLKRFKSKQ